MKEWVKEHLDEIVESWGDTSKMERILWVLNGVFPTDPLFAAHCMAELADI